MGGEVGSGAVEVCGATPAVGFVAGCVDGDFGDQLGLYEGGVEVCRVPHPAESDRSVTDDCVGRPGMLGDRCACRGGVRVGAADVVQAAMSVAPAQPAEVLCVASSASVGLAASGCRRTTESRWFSRHGHATTQHNTVVICWAIDHSVHDLFNGLAQQKWKRRSCGSGVHGQRIYDRARVEVRPWHRPDRRCITQWVRAAVRSRARPDRADEIHSSQLWGSVATCTFTPWRWCLWE